MLSFKRPPTFVLLPLVMLLLSSLIHAIDPSDRENLKQLQNIISSMDASIDPCDDFYAYACGNYPALMANSEYPEMLTTVQGKFLKNVQSILERQYPDVRQLKRHRQNYTDKLQIYLHSCVQQNGANLLHYLDYVKPDTDVEWPLLEELQIYQGTNGRSQRQPWSSQKYNILKLLGQLFSYGLNGDLIELSKETIDGIEVIGLYVPELQDLDAKDVAGILSQTGLPSEITDKYYTEILETQQEWQATYQEYANDEFKTKVSFGDMRETAPQIFKFLQGVLLPRRIEEDEMFLLNNPKYLEYLASLQLQPAEAEKLCNYLMIKFLLLLKDTVNVGNCITNANRRLHLAVNYIYYKNSYLHVAERKNDRLSDMLKKLYKHFLALIAENRLHFNDHQIQEIVTKIHHMPSNIGNLPANVTEAMVEDYYRSLTDMDINNYYKNELAVRKQALREACKCLPDMLCDNAVAGSPVNLPELNIVMFPFASLEPPMYHSQYDALMTLSLLGVITGHEFGHAIDPGTLNSTTHHTSFNSNITAHPGVRAAVECMQQQTPATEFIDERVADAVGVQVAYRAYSREYGVQPSYTTIPWQQLFFLNLAQFFCGKSDVTFQGHDADSVRMRHFAMNSEEFSQAFQCPRGSKMNPTTKCRYI